MSTLEKTRLELIHDLNNLVAAIRGYAGFLVDDLCASTKEHKHAEKILQAGDEAQAIINSLRGGH